MSHFETQTSSSRGGDGGNRPDASVEGAPSNLSRWTQAHFENISPTVKVPFSEPQFLDFSKGLAGFDQTAGALKAHERPVKFDSTKPGHSNIKATSSDKQDDASVPTHEEYTRLLAQHRLLGFPDGHGTPLNQAAFAASLENFHSAGGTAIALEGFPAGWQTDLNRYVKDEHARLHGATLSPEEGQFVNKMRERMMHDLSHQLDFGGSHNSGGEAWARSMMNIVDHAAKTGLAVIAIEPNVYGEYYAGPNNSDPHGFQLVRRASATPQTAQDVATYMRSDSARGAAATRIEQALENNPDPTKRMTHEQVQEFFRVLDEMRTSHLVDEQRFEHAYWQQGREANSNPTTRKPDGLMPIFQDFRNDHFAEVIRQQPHDSNIMVFAGRGHLVHTGKIDTLFERMGQGANAVSLERRGQDMEPKK